MIIAHSFNCGYKIGGSTSLEEAVDSVSAVPSGLESFVALIPAVETAGYCRTSFHDEGGNYIIGHLTGDAISG
jgi:hypothetical protein